MGTTKLGQGRRIWVEEDEAGSRTKPKFIKTQKKQNPNSQYPTKKKFIKSKINPKSVNNKTRTNHATTTTTRKLEIKESKRIGDEIDPEED